MAEKRTNKTAKELREESKKSLKERFRGEPIKQNYGESAGDFRKRQKREDDESPDNIKDRNIIGVAGQRVKTEGNKQFRKGTDFAKEKINSATTKAQQVKENFENRMTELRESTRSGPIKQKVGESSYAFRKRQQKEDDESPDNIKDRSLKNIAGQRLRTGANKQIRKTLENNPRAAAAVARANEIKKRVALKAQKFSNRAEELSRKAKILNARLKEIKKQLDLKQRLKDEIKKYAIRLLWPAISGILLILAKLLLVVIIIVIILVAVDYACHINILTDAACSAVAGIGSWFGF